MKANNVSPEILPGPRNWATMFAGSFAWRSVLFFCVLIAVVVAIAGVLDGGSDTNDEPSAIGWIVVIAYYFIFVSIAGMIVAGTAALVLAHVLISMPLLASSQQSFVTTFAAIAAALPFLSVFFAYRPGLALLLCIVLAIGNCAIAFRVARVLPPFPGSDMAGAARLG